MTTDKLFEEVKDFMTTDKLFEEVKDFALQCGMVCEDSDKPKNKSINAVVRKNFGKNKDSEEDGDKTKENSDYFGFIKEHNGPTGKYEDLSLVFFPQTDEKGLCSCIISLGVGTLGLPNDLSIASLPGTRRLFNRLGGTSEFFIKLDFTDITSDVVSDAIDSVNKKLKTTSDNNNKKEDITEVRKIAPKYKSYLQAGYILTKEDFENDDYKIIVRKWIATYAEFRKWPSNAKQREVINNLLLPKSNQTGISILKTSDSSESIEEILYRDRFIVLQGAPGTGKTYSALKIWDECFEDGNRFFEQFHAETTFSDFVYGIKPVLKSKNLKYTSNEGILLKAIKQAKKLEENYNDPKIKDKKPYRVLLIIDEINRANLSNVLGPVFFLFEKNREKSTVKIEYDQDNQLDSLPENLFVIATMNTADRSLAVVDFALRRRFTWLTLKPHPLDNKELNKNNKAFMTDEFEDFNKAFERYANDEELNLQPGQSYFIVNKKEMKKEMEKEMEKEMVNRLKYELMPLIKEYLNEGYLSNAKNYFYNYFYMKTGELLYE